MANTKISAFTAETDVANITGFAAFKTAGGSSTNVRISGSEIESTLNLSNFAVGTLAVGRGGTGATTFTANGVLIGNTASAISATAELADGQLLIGHTGNAPVAATLTQGTDLSITNGNGSISIGHAAIGNTPGSNSTTLSAGGTFTAINSVTVSTQGHLTAQNTETYTLPSDSDTTYAISASDGDNTDEEKIVLTAGGSGSGTSTVVLEAGTGLTVARSTDKITFTNSSPDQTVALTGGTGISTSGTYPNFTITNDAPDQTVALTGGTGISTSGTYPNFTITNDNPTAVSAANPSATISGTVTNGSASTFMRSDAVPALGSTITIGTGGSARGLVDIEGGNNLDAQLRLNCSAGTHAVVIEGPDHLSGSANYIVKLPHGAPALNKILKVGTYAANAGSYADPSLATMVWGDASITESFIIAASDETTALSTGTAKATFRMPYAFTLTGVRASVGTAPVGSVITVDINEAGSSILSTKITIDAGEKTSTTAATAPVISDSALADDAEITIDIDTVGSSTAGAGLKVTLIGNQ